MAKLTCTITGVSVEVDESRVEQMLRHGFTKAQSQETKAPAKEKSNASKSK
jgi:hypothetical protein